MVDLPRERYFGYEKTHISSNPKHKVDGLYSDEVDGLVRFLISNS